MRIFASIWGISLAFGVVAHAATLYKYVSPEGVVTYQNTPPPRSARHVQIEHLGDAASPRTFRQALAKLAPVTLYWAPNCKPCTQARRYLVARKVPFQSVNVAQNAATLKMMMKTTGSNTVPTIMVGKHVLDGYWRPILAKQLTAAGYPKRMRHQATTPQG